MQGLCLNKSTSGLGNVRPSSYIWILDSYIDYENTLNIKKISALLIKNLKSIYMDMYWPADT